MPAATATRVLGWVLVAVLMLIVLYLLIPGTHAPPFDQIDRANKDQLKAACNDPKLHFRQSQAQEADYATGVRVRITPEFFSFKNKPKDLDVGRVVALVQVLHGKDSLPYGLKDTIPACMFISGTHPTHLITTIISKEGEVLDTATTYVVKKFHLLAEAHWLKEGPVDAGSPVKQGFDLRPTSLFAESPATAHVSIAAPPSMLIFRYSQSTCTNHSCCISSGGH
jgi:hypothetical protein